MSLALLQILHLLPMTIAVLLPLHLLRLLPATTLLSVIQLVLPLLLSLVHVQPTMMMFGTSSLLPLQILKLLCLLLQDIILWLSSSPPVELPAFAVSLTELELVFQ